MSRAWWLVSGVLSVSAGCGVSTSTQERVPPPAAETRVDVDAGEPTIAVPENDADRRIRRGLRMAIDQRPELKQRDISFIVANGDVSLSGVVGTEDERSSMNELAMNIDGVRSVANALRVGE